MEVVVTFSHFKGFYGGGTAVVPPIRPIAERSYDVARVASEVRSAHWGCKFSVLSYEYHAYNDRSLFKDTRMTEAV